MPITISGSTGIAGVDGSAGTPAIQGTDTNTGIYFPGADRVGITSAAEQARSDIRFKYALIQETIDLSTTPDEIKAALGIN